MPPPGTPPIRPRPRTSCTWDGSSLAFGRNRIPPTTHDTPSGFFRTLHEHMFAKYNGRAMAADELVVHGAREHNLKDITVRLPRNRLICITGLSGSGKSSLAFDTIYAEGQRRYVESLSAYARQFLQMMEKPDVDHIDGLSPAISIDQKTTSRNPRSTV